MIQKHNLSKSFFWKFLERFSVQGTQFLIQIILARLLTPEHYGALAIMMIFINISNVIIQNGFNTSLIQNKDATDEDFSSVFWLLLAISTLVYILLYFSAPFLASYYHMPYLEEPFKILCLMLIPGALNSVQLAIIRRKMDFKKEFKSNVVSIIISGVAGISCAYLNFGLWALVIQVLLNNTIACITMWHVVGWRPQFVFNFTKVKILFSYGYKLVLAGLLDSLSNDLSAFIIGAKYNASSLGYYTRGKLFPSGIMGVLNSAVQSVMLPALASLQDNRDEAKKVMRNAMILSAFCVFPMMAILAGVAKPMVLFLLTDKWLECVPYIQIFCFSFAFWPVHTSNLQAINAMGRSDIFLKLEIYKKIMAWTCLAFAVFYFDTPLAIAGIGMLTTLISCFINSYPNKYLLNYSYSEQMKDILPYFFLSLLTFVLVNSLDSINDNLLVVLLLKSIVGCCFYTLIASVLKLKACIKIMERIKSKFYEKK